MAINAATLTATVSVQGAQAAAQQVEQFGAATQKAGAAAQQASSGTTSFGTATQKAGQDAASAATGVNQFDAAAQKAGQSASQSGGHLESLKGSLGDVAKLAGGFALGQGLIEAPAKLLEFAQAAAEDEASTQRVTQALKNAGASQEQYTRGLDDAIKKGQELAFSDDETRNAVTQLVDATGSADEAYRRLAVAQDLARGANISLEAASKLMGKTSDENVQTLKRLGINIADAATAQDTFNAVEAKFGGQAGTFAESAAGKYAKLKDSLAEIGESVGYLVLPALSAIAGAAVQVVEKVQAIMGAFSSSAPAQALAVLSKLPGPIQDAAKAAGIAALALAGLTLAYGALQTAIEAFNIVEIATNPILLAVAAAAAVATVMWEALSNAHDKVKASAEAVQTTLKQLIADGYSYAQVQDVARQAVEQHTAKQKELQAQLDDVNAQLVKQAGVVLPDQKKAHDDLTAAIHTEQQAVADNTKLGKDAADAQKQQTDQTNQLAEAHDKLPPKLEKTNDALAAASRVVGGVEHAYGQLKVAISETMFAPLPGTSPAKKAAEDLTSAVNLTTAAYKAAKQAQDELLNKPSPEQQAARARVATLEAEAAALTVVHNQHKISDADYEAEAKRIGDTLQRTQEYAKSLDSAQAMARELTAAVRDGSLTQDAANKIVAEAVRTVPALKDEWAKYGQEQQTVNRAWDDSLHAMQNQAFAQQDLNRQTKETADTLKIFGDDGSNAYGQVQQAAQDAAQAVEDETGRTIGNYGSLDVATEHTAQTTQDAAGAFVIAGGDMVTALDGVTTSSSSTAEDVQKNLDSLPPAAETSATGIGVAFSGLPDQLGGYAQAGTDALAQTGQGAIGPAGDTGKAIGDALGGSLLQTIQGWLGKLGDAVSSALDAARQQAAALAAGGAPGGYGPGGGSATQTQVESWLLGAGASPTEARTLSAIAMAESGGNAGISNLQGSGAQGLFQFMPGTAAGVGLANPNDPYAATLAALRLSRSSGGYGPWEAYTKGTYRAYMSATQGGSAPYGYATATGGPSPVGYLGMSVGPEPAPDSVLGFSQAGLDRLASLGITFGGQPGGTPWEQTRAGRLGTAIAGATAAGQAMAPAATGPMALAQALSAAQAQAQQQQAQAAEQAAQAALKAWQDAAAKFGNDSAEAAAAYEKYQTQQAQAAQKAAADALSSWVQSNHQRLQDEQNLSRDSQAIAKDNARVDQIAGTDRLAHHSAVTKGMLDDERRYTAGAQAFANQMAAAARAADLQVQADDTELSQTQDTNARAVLQVKRDADAAAAQSANQAATDAASDYRDAYGQMTSDATTFAAQQEVLAKIGSDAQRAAFNQNVVDAAAAEAEIRQIEQESIGVTDAAWLESANRRIDYLNGVVAHDRASNDEIVKNAQSAATAAQKAYNTVTGPPNVAAAAPAMSGSWSSATGIPASGAEISGMLVRGPDGELRPLVWLTPGQGPGQYRPPNVAPGVQPGTEQPATATTPPTVTPAPPVPGVGQPVVITLHLDKHRVASILVPDISQLQGRSVELAGYGS